MAGSLKSLSEPNLKTKIIPVTCHVCQRPLLILRHEREFVRDPVLDRKDLILVRRKVGRVRNAQIVIYLPPNREPRRRIDLPARDQRVDLKNVEAKKLVGRLTDRIINYSVSDHLGSRIDAGLSKRRYTALGICEVAGRNERDDIRLRQRRARTNGCGH